MSVKLAKSSQSSRPVLLLLDHSAFQEVLQEKLVALGYRVYLASELTHLPISSISMSLLSDLLDQLKEREPDASFLGVHPGLGGEGRNNEILQRVHEEGMEFIGPPVRVLNLLANRLNMLNTLESLGIPHRGHDLTPFQNINELEACIEKNGLKPPFILQSVETNVDGKRLSLRLTDFEEMAMKVEAWVEQLKFQCDDPVFLIENDVEGARLIEVPFVRFVDGTIQFFPSVDRSLRLGEEPILDFCLVTKKKSSELLLIEQHSKVLLDHIGYSGAGTLSFLVDGDRCYWSDFQPVLPIYFQLLETMTKNSLLKSQLASVFGWDPPKLRKEVSFSCGVSCQVRSEDPLFQLPFGGEVQDWELKKRNSDVVFYRQNNLLPKDAVSLGFFQATGFEKETTLQKLRDAISNLKVNGFVRSNQKWLIELLSHPWIQEGIFHTQFLSEEFIPTLMEPIEIQQIGVALASLFTDETQGEWRVNTRLVDQRVEVPLDFVSHQSFLWNQKKGKKGELLVFGKNHSFYILQVEAGRWWVRIGVSFFWVTLVTKKNKGFLRSWSHGVVHALRYREGAMVPAGEVTVQVETGGRLVPHRLSRPIKSIHWNVQTGDFVEAGQVLAEIELLNN